ncbi:hypothetical protein BGZ60DRAFT_529388 [Tricladium varicosporioides]|nr:hypothetical protein BGZ60DRAFT_529388 [Hymenoscyphus varicosporioides]
MTSSPIALFADEPDFCELSLTHFSLFRTLPFELRCEIWILSLPGPRSILPFRQDQSRIRCEDISAVRNPTALRVCQESRSVAQRYYQTWSNAKEMGYQYIDFKNDSIISKSDWFSLPGLTTRHVTFNSLSSQLLPKVDRKRIEKVELRMFGPDAYHRGGIGLLLSHWAEHCMPHVFPSVKQIDVSVFPAGFNHPAWVPWMSRLALEREVRYAGDEIWTGMNKIIEKNMEMRSDWLAPDVSIRIMIEKSIDEPREYLHEDILVARELNERLRQQAVLRGENFYIPSY